MNWTQSAVDSCLYRLYDPKSGTLCGLLSTHILMIVFAVVLVSFMKIKLLRCGTSFLLDSGFVRKICLLNIVDPQFNNSLTSPSKLISRSSPLLLSR